MESGNIRASFRDPSGHVYLEAGEIRRQVNPIYFSQYNALKQKGFFEFLFRKRALIPHREINSCDEKIILVSQKIPFVSEPYEWSFLQYKHAALLTLQIQIDSLAHGFTLKDASAFNITFFEGRPVFIDTLSFDFYHENQPWHAYKQFIMHFLGPLVLCHYYGSQHLNTLAAHPDGLPLQSLSRLLPFKSRLSPTLLTNIHLLARYDQKYAGAKVASANNRTLSKAAQLKLIEGLYAYIKNLKAKEHSEWDNYYNEINYEDSAFVAKKQLTRDWFLNIGAKSLIDIGGNDGTFSRVVADVAETLIVADIDANAVEQNYRKSIQRNERNILPLVVDILNPPPAIGFNNEERTAFMQRLTSFAPDACLALAVIHHLTLSGNVPFAMSARFFAQIAPQLLIEFPTREDSWVQFLLDSKREFKAHFDFYNEVAFEEAYSEYFEIVNREQIPGAHRILYTMKTKKIIEFAPIS